MFTSIEEGKEKRYFNIKEWILAPLQYKVESQSKYSEFKVLCKYIATTSNTQFRYHKPILMSQWRYQNHLNKIST